MFSKTPVLSQELTLLNSIEVYFASLQMQETEPKKAPLSEKGRQRSSLSSCSDAWRVGWGPPCQASWGVFTVLWALFPGGEASLLLLSPKKRGDSQSGSKGSQRTWAHPPLTLALRPGTGHHMGPVEALPALPTED